MKRQYKAATNILWRFWSKVAVKGDDDCWEWQGSRAGRKGWDEGYGRFRINTVTVYAHIMSWQMSHGRERPKHLFVMHSCDNPPCVNPKHLELGTHRQNMIHAAKVYRVHNKIGARAVPVIRHALSEGASANHLRKLWGVCHRSITNIRDNRTYIWVEQEAA